MADHFGGEIFFLLTFILFIGVLFGWFFADLGTQPLNAPYTPEIGDSFENSWLHIGDNLNFLATELPLELFVLIIVPLIGLGLYIAFKTASQTMPNWLSGG